MILADQIVGLLKEGVVAYRVYLDGKLERYNLHLRKKRAAAIKIADRMDETTREVFAFVHEQVGMDDDTWKKFYTLKKKYYKLDKKFDNLT